MVALTAKPFHCGNQPANNRVALPETVLWFFQNASWQNFLKKGLDKGHYI